MANFFDQFDQQPAAANEEENFFNQFDQPEPQPTQATAQPAPVPTPIQQPAPVAQAQPAQPTPVPAPAPQPAPVPTQERPEAGGGGWGTDAEMKERERQRGGWGYHARETIPQAIKTGAVTAWEGAKQFVSEVGMDFLMPDVIEINPELKQEVYGDSPVIQKLERVTEASRKSAQESLDELVAVTPPNQTFWQKAVTTSAVSLSQSLPAMLLGPNGAPMAFGVSEFLRSYGDARLEGKPKDQAIRYGIVNGMFEGVTEKIPMRHLFADTHFVKKFINFMGAELPGEITAEVGQRINEILSDMDPNVTAGEFKEYMFTPEFAHEMFELIQLTAAATLISGGVQTTAMRMFQKAVGAKPMTEEERKAEEDKRIAAEDVIGAEEEGAVPPPTTLRAEPEPAPGAIVTAEEQIRQAAEEEQRLEREIADREFEAERARLPVAEVEEGEEVGKKLTVPKSKGAHLKQITATGEQYEARPGEPLTRVEEREPLRPVEDQQLTPEEEAAVEEDKRFWEDREFRVDDQGKMTQDIPNRPSLTAADMEGMAPEERNLVERDEYGIEYYDTPDGFYAIYDGREIGFALPMAEDPKQGFDVSVAKEWGRRGVGGKLMGHFLKKHPGYPTGGLTRAGRGMATKAGLVGKEIRAIEDDTVVKKTSTIDPVTGKRKKPKAVERAMDRIAKGRVRTGVQEVDEAIVELIHGKDRFKIQRAKNLLRKRLRPAVQYTKKGGGFAEDVANEGEGHLNLAEPDAAPGTVEWGYKDLETGEFYSIDDIGGLDATDLMTDEETQMYLRKVSKGKLLESEDDQLALPLKGGLNAKGKPIRVRRPREKAWWESEEHVANREKQLRDTNAVIGEEDYYSNGVTAAIKRFGRTFVDELYNAARDLGVTITWVRVENKYDRRTRLREKRKDPNWREGFGGMVQGTAALGSGGGSSRLGVILNADMALFKPEEVLAHEFGHVVAANAPDLWNDLATFAQVNWPVAMRKSAHSYLLKRGVTPQMLNAFKEEIIGDALSTQLFTKEFQNRVARFDPDFATRTVARLKILLAKMKAVFTGYNEINREFNTYFKNYDALLDKWAETVAKYRQTEIRKKATATMEAGYAPYRTPELVDPPDLDYRKDMVVRDFLEAVEQLGGSGALVDLGIRGYADIKNAGRFAQDIRDAMERMETEEVNRKMSAEELDELEFEPWERELHKAHESGDKTAINLAVQKAAASAPSDQKLLGIDSNAKTVKGQEFGFITGILYLSPGKSSGFNLCPKASAGCLASCLNTSGRGANREVQRARLQKTARLKADQDKFFEDLSKEIEAIKKAAHKKGMIPVIRLNGTSDEVWEAAKYRYKGKSIMEHFPEVQFYDYTKFETRVINWAQGKLPPNYHLTFSRSETNDADALKVLKAGGNVAVVFRDGLPKTWNGFEVVNGDSSDLRHRDPKGVVVGLVAKGEGKKDMSGFVVDLPFSDIEFRPPVGSLEKDMYKVGATYDKDLNRYVFSRKPSAAELEEVTGKDEASTKKRRAAVLKRYADQQSGKLKPKKWESALERARKAAAKTKQVITLSSDVKAGLNRLNAKEETVNKLMNADDMKLSLRTEKMRGDNYQVIEFDPNSGHVASSRIVKAATAAEAKLKFRSARQATEGTGKRLGESQRTAISRNKPSAPMRFLEKLGALGGKMLDYGSGRGKDADYYGMDKYDPYFAPTEPQGQYDIITSNFVLNVLSKKEADAVIEKVRGLLKPGGVAYFSVRRDIKKDGMTSKGTYQRTVMLGKGFELVHEVRGGYAIYRMVKDEAKYSEEVVNKYTKNVEGEEIPWDGTIVDTSPMNALKEGRPMEAVLRAMFKYTGANWAIKRSGTLLGKGFTEYVPFRNAKQGTLRGGIRDIVMVTRMGTQDKFGLPESHKENIEQAKRRERMTAMKGLDLVTELMQKSVTNSAEGELLGMILTGETIPTKTWAAVAAPIREAITELGQEAVDFGLISQESFDRNKATYLHRVYKKHEYDNSKGMVGVMKNFMSKRRRKMIGSTMKGRGMFLDVTHERLAQDLSVSEMQGLAKGQQYSIYTKMKKPKEGEVWSKPKVLKRVFIPHGHDVSQYERDPSWTNQGTNWELREMGNNKVTLWRDFTKDERVKMGEILDARYTILKTFHAAASDLANGELFANIAADTNVTYQGEGAPDVGVVEEMAKFGLVSRLYYGVDWFKVPNTTIPNTGGKKKFGALAGKYVKANVWRDLQDMDAMQNHNFWAKLMTQWKLNKTARNPVVHMNNIMANFMLMDLADVRGTDFIRGLRAWVDKDDPKGLWREAENHGAFDSTFILSEIQQEKLKPMLREVLNEMVEGDEIADSVGNIGKFINKLASVVSKFDNKMTTLYQLEDQAFRMALYINRRRRGVPREVAALEARKRFIDYDIHAPWVNLARRTVLPFLAYSYRAIPMVAETLVNRPWKVAKWVMISHAMHALGYAMAGGDPEEDQELMPERERGTTWLQTPRMIRMAWNDEYGNPMHLDVRRWIPAADVFDIGANSPVPTWLQWGGPLMLGAEIIYNHSNFTGRELWNPITSDSWDVSYAVASHLYQSWLPSSPWIPGSWYFMRIAKAMAGAREYDGRTYNKTDAFLNSIGIKIKPLNKEYRKERTYKEIDAYLNELESEEYFLERDYQDGRVMKVVYDFLKARLEKKRQKLIERAQKTLQHLS